MHIDLLSVGPILITLNSSSLCWSRLVSCRPAQDREVVIHSRLSFSAILKEDFPSFRRTVRDHTEVRRPHGHVSLLRRRSAFPFLYLYLVSTRPESPRSC